MEGRDVYGLGESLKRELKVPANRSAKYSYGIRIPESLKRELKGTAIAEYDICYT